MSRVEAWDLCTVWGKETLRVKDRKWRVRYIRGLARKNWAARRHYEQGRQGTTAVTTKVHPGRTRLSDKDFDFHRVGEPKYFYFVASTERSGSTHLCTKFWQTGILGAPHEYFNFNNTMLEMAARLGARSLNEYLRRLFEVRTSANGAFGAKMHWSHLQFLQLAKILPEFPTAQWIFADRRDSVAQAVSFAKAVQTQQWTSLAEPQAGSSYDFETVLSWYKQLMVDKESWRRFFESAEIQPVNVFYEDFIARPDAIIADIVGKFGFPTEPRSQVVLPEISRQGDETNFEWVVKFMRDAEEQGYRLPSSS